MYKEIYYRELANVIIEAEKSQYLSSVSWRPRKASDVSSNLNPKTKGPETLMM